jgi:hypothetical protein
MATIECKVAMVISRLVKLELHLELKFEQKRVLHAIPCVKQTARSRSNLFFFKARVSCLWRWRHGPKLRIEMENYPIIMTMGMY